MDKLNQTLELVTTVFSDAYGYNPTNIRSLSGESPSENNSYLFVAAMLTYQGLLTTKSGGDMLFFIYFDAETKEWKYDFTAAALGNTQSNDLL